MNKLLNVFVAAAVSVFAAAPAMAHAERIFYLVGTRHVYMIGKDMYAHVDEREKIEQDYADEVAADNDTYQKALADGSDQQKETDDLNSALDDRQTSVTKSSERCTQTPTTSATAIRNCKSTETVPIKS